MKDCSNFSRKNDMYPLYPYRYFHVPKIKFFTHMNFDTCMPGTCEKICTITVHTEASMHKIP